MSETTSVTIAVAVLTSMPAMFAAMAAFLQTRRTAKSVAESAQIARNTADLARIAAADTAKDVSQIARTAETAKEKTEELVVESGKIHKLVNSNLDKVREDLAKSQEEIAVLHRLIKKLVEQGNGKEEADHIIEEADKIPN